MLNFEWDENKDRLNRKKHGIGFDRAKSVFDDESAIAYSGKPKEGENRFLIVGKVLGKFIIAVVFTIRSTVYRLISARQAQKSEIKDYLTHKLNKDVDGKKN